MDDYSGKDLSADCDTRKRVETRTALCTSRETVSQLAQCAVHPPLCLTLPFEATRVSVGRGTTFPFQVLGAPNKKYGDFAFTPRSLPGFDKNPMHKGVTCYGEDLRNVTDVNGFTLRYFLRFYRLSGEGAAFFSRPRWFDLLMGTDSVRKAILKGESEEEIRDSWQKELQTYRDMRQKYLLY